MSYNITSLHDYLSYLANQVDCPYQFLSDQILIAKAKMANLISYDYYYNPFTNIRYHQINQQQTNNNFSQAYDNYFRDVERNYKILTQGNYQQQLASKYVDLQIEIFRTLISPYRNLSLSPYFALSTIDRTNVNLSNNINSGLSQTYNKLHQLKSDLSQRNKKLQAEAQTIFVTEDSDSIPISTKSRGIAITFISPLLASSHDTRTSLSPRGSSIEISSNPDNQICMTI